MTRIKSLLLASAAGLVAAISAQAADLPSKKAAPAEYMKVCSVNGEGFFYIPGSDTCLKLSGFVRSDYQYQNTGKAADYGLYRQFLSDKTTQFARSSRSQNLSGFAIRVQMMTDARTMTDYGTLRSYMSLRYHNVSGANPEEYSHGFVLDKGFIQWAGLTAGHAQSMFDFFADALGYDDLRGPDHSVNMLAYTATFGNGFAATLSLEDTDQLSYQTPGVASFAVPSKGVATATAWGFQGTRQPDVVGALGLDQSWGSAQLAALYHTENVESSTDTSARHKDATSWAVNGGVHLKLPMIAPGDELWLQATYTKGDLGLQTQGYPRGWNGAKGWVLPDYDAVVVNDSVKLPTAWSSVLAFQHNWSAQWASHIEASYLNVRYPSQVRAPSVSAASGITNWNEWRVGVGTDWMPVKNLMIGLEIFYIRLDQKAPLLADGKQFAGAGGVPFKKNIDNVEGIFRVQRNF